MPTALWSFSSVDTCERAVNADCTVFPLCRYWRKGSWGRLIQVGNRTWAPLRRVRRRHQLHGSAPGWETRRVVTIRYTGLILPGSSYRAVVHHSNSTPTQQAAAQPVFSSPLQWMRIHSGYVGSKQSPEMQCKKNCCWWESIGCHPFHNAQFPQLQ